jgi:ribosomal protein L37AE/L43A
MSKYQRKFNCAVCKQPFVIEKVMNGWIGVCGCGKTIKPASYHPEDSEHWERVE